MIKQGTFDAVHVLEASILVCTQNIQTIIKIIEAHAALSRHVATGLLECKGHYAKALVSLHQALKAIHARNFGVVSTVLGGIVADVTSAEAKVMDLKVASFKFEYFSFVSVTASNCLSISSLIPH